MSTPDKSYVLALDQGSQSTRACLFNLQGELLYQSSKPIDTYRFDRHKVEQIAPAIADTLNICLRDVFYDSGVNPHDVVAVGLACERSSVLAWDSASGTALSPILSWQDTRTEAQVAALAEDYEWIYERSGLVCSAHYGASKIAWLLEQGKVNFPPNLCVSPVASYYIHHLLGSGYEPVVDHANALRSQLVDIDSLDWDSELLNTFQVPREVLPDLKPVRFNYGVLHGMSLPLTAVNGDQTAALFANGDIGPDTALVNLGTGGFVLTPSSTRQQIPGLLCSVSDSDETSTSYVCEGTVNGVGSALSWAREHLSMDQEERISLGTYEEGAKLLFMNTVSGLGSPWWKTGIEPYWCDLTGQRVNQPEPCAALAAVFESIAFLVFCNVALMQDSACPIRQIHISGGMSQMDPVCQLLADLSSLPVTRLAESEATARGIAFLAAGRPKDWQRDFGRSFQPQNRDGQAAISQRYQIFLNRLKTIINK